MVGVPHPTDLLPNYHKEKNEQKDVKNKSSFHTPAHKDKMRGFGRIALPHLNLTFNFLNVLLDLAEELVRPMEQQGV